MKVSLALVTGLALLATTCHSRPSDEEYCPESCPPLILHVCKQHVFSRKYYKFSHPCRLRQCECKNDTPFYSADLHHCNGLPVDYCPPRDDWDTVSSESSE
ncbi:uncharacterized protein LOC126455652 isoform X2 [Schistocerca serialis cubense]|uniref:uncharacterized protein LOC126455652 isoform X2 n=1 Tax=Schistocerca serialis cubense TaxID=2023355 RepID=UPI00214E08C1|nr:uncharacterized protein LOC126455652 isoform X2 [Schistocerca serialis cubense]